jgi:decaprenyl-phosphate phosphoribosyltransferase
MHFFQNPSALPPYVRILRPLQWAKNVAVFAPVLFGGYLFSPLHLGTSLAAFAVLSLLSSSHYIVNDLIDLPANRLHPTKRTRPLPSGAVTIRGAWMLWGACVIGGAVGALALGPTFAAVALVFSSLHYLLLFYFRYRRILDILALASGYALRLWAGQVATGIHISIWLSLSAFCVSLLFAIGKRRYDAAVASSGVGRKRPGRTTSLYSTTLLDAYMAMFATASFVSYSYFTFLTTFTGEGFGQEGAVGFLVGRKWLMASIPFVLFAIMRYLQLMYVIEGTETSHQALMVKDMPLIISVAGWAVTVILVVYGIGR